MTEVPECLPGEYGSCDLAQTLNQTVQRNNENINRILDAGGKPPVTRSISPAAAYGIGAILEWVYRSFGIAGEPRMTRFVARELATSHWFDISAAKRDLGYTAEVSIDEGMQRLKAWLQKSAFPLP